MGWISKRHLRRGGTIGGMKGKRHKGPLRQIVGYIEDYRKADLFNPPTVLLECGHKTQSWGQLKARCAKCGQLEKENG